MSDVHPINGRPLVAAKLCGGCLRRVSDDEPVGAMRWCEFAYCKAPVIVKRLPLWKRRLKGR